LRSVRVSASKDYEVWIGEGLLAQAGARIAAVCGGKVAMLVTDDVVNKLYGNAAEQSLQRAGYSVTRFIFPHGERSKNMEIYASLLHALAKANLTRSDALVALGGGVVGDVAGFTAATYLRGIRLAQIPTTLLSMVDSSVGGKTGVDLPTGKNQVGAFYQPDIVLCDIATLQTLTDDIFADGCAEMIKHGAALSAELFELLKQPLQPQLEDVIARNIMIKRDIVAADEQDTGIRQILNFGHTIGHAIEKQSGYSISHGKAVAIGMAIASRGAFCLGMCTEDCYREIKEMIKRFNLPLKTDIPPEQLAEAAYFDKKRSGQSISIILPERIGKCVIRNFEMDELAEFISLGT